MDRLGHVITCYTFSEDPRFLCELMSIVNRLVAEHEDVAEILGAESSTPAMRCIKECQSNFANPTLQTKRRMRAAWAKLSFQEQFDLEKVAVYQKNDDLRVQTLLRLAGVSVSEWQTRKVVHRATDTSKQVLMIVRGRKIVSL